MENDNSGVDILKLLADFERNMVDESSTGETTGMPEDFIVLNGIIKGKNDNNNSNYGNINGNMVT